MNNRCIQIYLHFCIFILRLSMIYSQKLSKSKGTNAVPRIVFTLKMRRWLLFLALPGAEIYEINNSLWFKFFLIPLHPLELHFFTLWWIHVKVNIHTRAKLHKYFFLAQQLYKGMELRTYMFLFLFFTNYN